LGKTEKKNMTKYHHTAPLKFVILSMATLGIYELYWCYKCWCYIKGEGRKSIHSFWRAFFAPILDLRSFQGGIKKGKNFVRYNCIRFIFHPANSLEIAKPVLLINPATNHAAH